ncbi:MAG: RND transporter [Sphingobacteriales bacterium]|nr:MAG: RND transporter [Sphingobacteriales bacterium]
MWTNLARFVLKNRLPVLIFLFLSTIVMGYFASQVKMSYEFARAIPTDNPKYKEYQEFRQKFGDDGNTMVIGFSSDKFFDLALFNSYTDLGKEIKKVDGVNGILSIPETVSLVKDSATEKLKPVTIFKNNYQSQAALDSARAVFESQLFYKGLLYNPASKVYLMAVSINKEVLSSPKRNVVVAGILNATSKFEKQNNIQLAISGLPMVRTIISTRIADEMKLFLLGSVLLSALILLIFFRSVSATLLSIAVVIIGVLWSLGTMHLFEYKITLLNALIPPLIVVIGIPNCIYFLNKYHTEYRVSGNKEASLINMVSRMGVVTLFCNITAAIGFAVFALTKSAVLKEFGVVAGINIMSLFFVSFMLLPASLSYLPMPKPRHVKYLDNPWLNKTLIQIEKWVFDHRKTVYALTVAILIFAVVGIFKLKSVGYIVDDLPKNDKLYTDLKFFEKHFHGVMPLEIVVDTKKKYGVSRNLTNLLKIDSLAQYIASKPEMAKPLSLDEGLKFARQGYYGDSTMYAMPDNFDLAFLAPYLQMKGDSSAKANSFSKLVSTFMDSSKQMARISVSMEDVGSARLPLILKDIQTKAELIFNRDSMQYQLYLDSLKEKGLATKNTDTTSFKQNANIQLTGTSVTFLEGSRYIINGLKDSIIWAFVLIAFCMLYLFRSVKILLCSLIPNIIPLVITAGVMGWVGIPLKPSTVLVFSVALGIAIDVTIRFLVNYKQELPHQNNSIPATIQQTIRHTGISIIYTSLVLIAGFIIFCFSNFGGTQALGWLTSLTLVVAMITNLVLLPVLLISVSAGKTK